MKCPINDCFFVTTEFQRSWSLALFVLITMLDITVAAADDPSTVASAIKRKRPIVILHSYLASPARLAKLRQTAEATSLDLRFVAADSVDAETVGREIVNSRCCLFDIPHESVAEGIFKKCAPFIEQSKSPYLIVGELDQVRSGELIAFGPLASERGIASAWAVGIRQYYRYGGQLNTRNLIEILERDLPAESSADLVLPAVKPFPEQGFYHPKWHEIETDISEVIRVLGQDKKPIVAIAVNRSVLAAEDTTWLDKVISSLAERNVDSYAFYGPRQNKDLFTQMTCPRGEDAKHPIVDCIVNASLVFRPQERKIELDQLGVPVLQTLPALKVNTQQWLASSEGLAVADISYYYASSELAGMIDPILISARDSNSGMLQPIVEQIAAVADRVQAACRLRRSDRAERRVTMMVYNYPQGENNFGASFLNVPRSLVNVLSAMRDAGYSTEVLSEEELTSRIKASLRALYDRSSLIALHATGDADFLTLRDYEAWFAELPMEARQRIDGYWGSPASMAVQMPNSDQMGFIIPAVRLGNVRILPQPLRHEINATKESSLRKKRISHKSTVPLSHTYLATYLCVRQQWQSHALIHFGTHGTLEWAPGKTRALSVNDDPYLALGAMPVFYPYIMDNLGEATTAKRRGRATMISHLTPMFTPAGFRPGLHEMHDLMHDWETVAPGPVRQQMEKQLVAKFIDDKLDRDLGWSPPQIAGNFQGFMEVLHPYLDDIAQTAQPQGLVSYGAIPDEERRFGMIMQMLRKPLIDALGEDIDEVFLLDSEKVINSRPARWLRLALKDPAAASQLDLRKIDQLDTQRHTSVPNRAAQKSLDPGVLLALAERARQLDAALSSNEELASLLAALDGKHVPSSYGGDPVRNPGSLPTGRNLYGFDPTRVPTQQAWEIGVGVLDDWLKSYRQTHEGQFPKQIAFTMWAGETMRHQGVMESQILHAIGVKPRWDEAGRLAGTEVVPATALNRPRIDVLLSVTGSYRDQFPQLMNMIDMAIREVALIDEPDNTIAKHVESLQKEFEATGTAPADAFRRSSVRIFSNETGSYGTGLNDAVYASDLWENQTMRGGDAQMADLFIERMGFAYGDGLDGVAAPKLFAKQLSNVDVAFLSRSSNTYGVLTSDDPFAYLGGFALAARVSSGREPELYVQNLRDESEVIIDSAGRAIAKEMQTRYLHPHWIKSQQAEGYSGTLQVLKATQFLWGWQVTSPESIRQDQWQSLFDVYVNDQYKLGTRQWFDHDNEHAMAQILERMIDAMRLNYWQPDATTQRDILVAYEQAKQSTGLIESNPEVTKYVASQRQIELDSKPDLAASMSETQIVKGGIANTPQIPLPQESQSEPNERVHGKELRPQPVDTKTRHSAKRKSVILLGSIIALILIGGCLQHRRLSAKRGDSVMIES
jgi:cobaltochelatase CobN